MTMMATAQRGRLYRDGVSADERQRLRAALRARLEGLATKYAEPVTDSDHVATIVEISDDLSSRHPRALCAGRFRIGSAQKALNLYLKYLWCLGEATMPPHCPFDSVVLAEVPGCRQVRWTKLDSADEYERIVCAARNVAGGLPLAEWELQFYNRAANRDVMAVLGS